MQYMGNQKTAIVNERVTGYRVVCFNNYFETQEEHFFTSYSDAHDFAEQWVKDGDVAYQ